MSCSAEDDLVVPFGDGGPVETLDKLARIRLGYTCTWAFMTPPVTAARQLQNYVSCHKHVKLLLPFCKLQLIAG